MITFPEAKINLGLNVVAKRPDGYHDLSTIFTRIPLCDALEVVPSTTGATEWDDGDSVLSSREGNLVWRAYTALLERYPERIPPLHIVLRKFIPSGAGLGGGSSDASHMLLLLRDLFSLPASDDELATIAVSLGADCPFFLHRTPMYATGIGEVLEPIDLPLLRGLHLYLALPHAIQVSTAEAYGGVHPDRWALPLPEAISRPIEQWRDYIFNDFEPHIFERYPRLLQIKEHFYEKGATFALMSGSGSTIYALAHDTLDVESMVTLFDIDIQHFILK